MLLQNSLPRVLIPPEDLPVPPLSLAVQVQGPLLHVRHALAHFANVDVKLGGNSMGSKIG